MESDRPGGDGLGTEGRIVQCPQHLTHSERVRGRSNSLASVHCSQFREDAQPSVVNGNPKVGVYSPAKDNPSLCVKKLSESG